ncbi:hypothetical protein RRG08_013754 [Elysia crispata]|uniref:Uncharacterized protein n=1 Tax=Elysia crispata TaxID=231223 RepID=A0AAE0ZPT8_9GAST|nr:hypothetical protein RRG08_013754 [Elysia crispata]
MADEGSADRTVTSKTIANLLNQARNCNALSMADEELFQQHLNEFFGEPDEEDEEELGDPSTIYAALAPDQSSRGTQPVSDEDGSDDDDFVPVVVRGNYVSQLTEQLDVEPEESSQPSDDFDELEPLPPVPHCGCKYHDGQPCYTFF